MADHGKNTPTRDRRALPAGASDFPDIQDGRYKFIEVIDSGGAGTVYRALDTSLDKQVAIKKLHSSASDIVAMRFQREARMAASLKHQNVMNANDFGLTAKNEPYLILDYVNGTNLSKVIQEHGPMPLHEALSIFIQVAAGIEHAHKSNVIHRDIKPSNVMLVHEPKTGEFIAKVVDFGLAKMLDDDQSLTKSRTAVGTPEYMSPEQLHGIGVDQRSDVYSFGCLMFHVLSGKPPFVGETAIDVASMHINDEPPTLRSAGVECSESMEEIVRRCLHKDPARRFHSFQKLGESLENELRGINEDGMNSEQTSTKFSETIENLDAANSQVKTARSNRTIPLVVAGLAGLILAVVLSILVVQEQNSTSENEAKIEKRLALDSRAGFVNPFAYSLDDPLDGKWIRPNATDEEVQKATKMHEITDMVLTGSKLSDETWIQLANLNVAKRVAITGVPITKELIGNISRIKSIDTLDLGETDDIDPEALPDLNAMPHLYDFRLYGVKLDKRITTNIAKIKNITSLKLSCCTNLRTTEILEPLIKLPRLDYLKLDGSDLDDEGLKGLSRLNDLNTARKVELYLAGTKITDQGLNVLDFEKLAVLDLNGCSNITAKKIRTLEKVHDGVRILHKYSLPSGSPAESPTHDTSK